MPPLDNSKGMVAHLGNTVLISLTQQEIARNKLHAFVFITHC